MDLYGVAVKDLQRVRKCTKETLFLLINVPRVTKYNASVPLELQSIGTTLSIGLRPTSQEKQDSSFTHLRPVDLTQMTMDSVHFCV